jgi:ribonuclease T1
MRAAALALLLACGAVLAFSGEVRFADLPAQARETVALIRAGGPLPYARDGSVFSNREGQLPKRRRGYYHEYTVKTPGASDRGARRIVVGEGGELYYTDDHYRSFRRVIE